MKVGDLNTGQKITWCPGCLDFSVMLAAKQAITNLVNENKIDFNNVVGVSGVGCHDKIYDYIKTNFYHALHGRVMPTVFGIKFGNPELKVIGFGGDGATYSEGMAHFVHACRYNADVTFIVLNNQVFSLTTGQATPASEKGLVTPSTPLGTKEFPVNPVNLALTCGATFVARGSAFDVPHLTKIIEEAIMHKGFSFIDIVLPCISYHNNTQFLREHVYKMENHDANNHEEAMKKSLEWNYCYKDDAKIPTGIFYKTEKPVFCEQYSQMKTWHEFERKPDYKKILKEFK